MRSFEVGIYGGTFAPIHNGHIAAARAFYDLLELDRLLIIPTFIPPHKLAEEGDSPESRLEMTRLAFLNEKRKIEVSDYEIRQRGTSYTYLTLQHFYEKKTNLTFLCGTDMFLSLDEWKKPNIIFSLATIAFVRRHKCDEKIEIEIKRAKERYEKNYSARIVDLDINPIEISSTEIREKAAKLEDLSDLVPKKVEEYIVKNSLYRKDNI